MPNATTIAAITAPITRIGRFRESVPKETLPPIFSNKPVLLTALPGVGLPVICKSFMILLFPEDAIGTEIGPIVPLPNPCAETDKARALAKLAALRCLFSTELAITLAATPAAPGNAPVAHSRALGSAPLFFIASRPARTLAPIRPITLAIIFFILD